MATKQLNLSPEYLAEDNTSALLATCIAFLVLNTVFVTLRFAARYWQAASWGWDDFFMALAWLTACGLCIDGIVARRFGAGLHIERVEATMPEQIPNWGKNGFYAVPIIYVFAVTFPKISVLMLYLRVFVDRFSRVCCWLTLGALVISGIINTFITGFQCNTPAASWDPNLPGGHCMDIQAHLTYGSVPNIVTDVAMLLLPVPVVLKLQAATHVKVGLLATFLVGSAGLVTSIFRFTAFFTNPYASDPTWYAAPLIMWVVIESGIYVICASLLTYRAILAKFVYTKRVSLLYAWLRKTTSTVTSRFDRSPQSKQTSKRLSRGTNGTSFVPASHNKETDSVVAFAGHGEYIDLESGFPKAPNGIHVQHGFDVTSRGLTSL